jgi:hypothetical protein
MPAKLLRHQPVRSAAEGHPYAACEAFVGDKATELWSRFGICIRSVQGKYTGPVPTDVPVAATAAAAVCQLLYAVAGPVQCRQANISNSVC